MKDIDLKYYRGRFIASVVAFSLGYWLGHKDGKLEGWIVAMVGYIITLGIMHVLKKIGTTYESKTKQG